MRSVNKDAFSLVSTLVYTCYIVQAVLFVTFTFRRFPTGLKNDLQNVWLEDNFAIALSNIKVKNKQYNNVIDILLVIKYGESKSKMILMLDRRTKRGEPTD